MKKNGLRRRRSMLVFKVENLALVVDSPDIASEYT